MGTERNVSRFVRENAAGFVLELFINFVAPFVIYNATQAKLGDVRALLWSSAPPVLWSIVEFVRKRRIDALSILVIAGIVLSLLAFFGGGSARVLQLRENLIGGLIALVFLISAAIGKPLVYQLARAAQLRKSPADAEAFEKLRDNVFFRRSMTVMTLVWGFGLLAQTALACVLVFALSIREYLLVSPIVGYGAYGALTLWTVWYSRRQRRIGVARRAATEATGPSR